MACVVSRASTCRRAFLLLYLQLLMAFYCSTSNFWWLPPFPDQHRVHAAFSVRVFEASNSFENVVCENSQPWFCENQNLRIQVSNHCILAESLTLCFNCIVTSNPRQITFENTACCKLICSLANTKTLHNIFPSTFQIQ